MKKNGFSLPELLFALALGAIVMTIAIPAFRDALRRSQHDAGVRQVLGEMRQARARAISTGWEYMIVGYDRDSGNPRRNQYRLFARRTAATPWPGEEDPSTETANLLIEDWHDLPEDFSGLEFNTPNPRFELLFDRRGAAPGAAADFNPLQIVDPDGRMATVNVSVVGGIRIQ